MKTFTLVVTRTVEVRVTARSEQLAREIIEEMTPGELAERELRQTGFAIGPCVSIERAL